MTKDIKPIVQVGSQLIDTTTKEHDCTEYFRFLDALRESGATNMFGAAPYVEEMFDVKRSVAQHIVSLWMETYDGKSTPEERAEKAGPLC